MNHMHQKVTASHLSRDAYLYVRQSTVRQVFENAESTRRQYALRDRAVALGWPTERIIVIDSDLGLSGADSDREGFQHLVAEVGMGRAGIVLGLEVSRLARNSTDWHRLLEICALSETLILDEDGIYNPGDFNDRLLLGLKGTMSEAELHLLRARLRGGILNQARRGELKMPLPVGLVYDPLGRVVLDPDAQVQNSLRLLFDTFARTGSACATVKHFRKEKLDFPIRLRRGPHKGELHWQTLRHSRVLQVLHNPRYAGAFAFGRTRQRRRPGGGVEGKRLPREEWTALLIDAHPGYISWERFEANQRQLRDNTQSRGADRPSTAREGSALLQGLALCGVCGHRMTVRYHTRRGCRLPDYSCQSEGIETARANCQNIPGAGIDRAIGELLVELMTPVTLEVAMQVQDELTARAEEADAWRAQQVQRAREEADLARHRFMQTHPDNRMVADVLEAEWNAKLRALDEAQHNLEHQRDQHSQVLDERQRQRILTLATDFPRLWNDPATPNRERKRMARLLIEDVTLTKGEELTVGVRLRGGATRTLTLAPEQPSWKIYQTPKDIVAEIDRLLDDHTDTDVARILNERGRRSGHGLVFNMSRVQGIRRNHGLKTRYERLRARGLLTLDEIADRLAVSTWTIKKRRRRGLLRGHAFDGRNCCLYELPDQPGDQPHAGEPPARTGQPRSHNHSTCNRGAV